MQTIRMVLRGRAVLLMGKNTMMRKALRGHIEKNPLLEKILPHIKGNVGFVFTKDELVGIRDVLVLNKVRAPAKAGALAPLDVIVPAQNTGLGPEKTSFFQESNRKTRFQRALLLLMMRTLE
jgi:large subunit ribosomal protein LP0